MTARTNTIGAIPVASFRSRASMTALGAANFPGGRRRQTPDRAAGDFSERWAAAPPAYGSSDRGAQMARKAWPPLLPAARSSPPPFLRAASECTI